MLDKSTVKNMAFLARIEIDDADLAPLAEQLSKLVGWVEHLGEVNTDGVEPMTSVSGQALRWRADAVTDGGNAQTLLLNAPDCLDDCFSVPKMVD